MFLLDRHDSRWYPLFSALQIRNELEKHMNCNLKEFKEFIDNEMLLILGQMDKPSLIFDHLYLVSCCVRSSWIAGGSVGAIWQVTGLSGSWIWCQGWLVQHEPRGTACYPTLCAVFTPGPILLVKACSRETFFSSCVLVLGTWQGSFLAGWSCFRTYHGIAQLLSMHIHFLFLAVKILFYDKQRSSCGCCPDVTAICSLTLIRVTVSFFLDWAYEVLSVGMARAM